MSMNFWKPMSEPKPASVTTASTSLSAMRSATTEELPWAMLANGPAWMKAGPPSSVWTRFGLIASRSSTVIAPATLSSSSVTGCTLEVLGHDHAAQARPQVVDVRGEGQDGHHFRRGGDVPLRLAHAGFLAKPDFHPPQRAIVDVDHARPADRGRIDANGVAAEEVVVEEGRGQVVGRGDGVQVAGEVDVDLFHRQDLAEAAAGGAAFEAEHWPE